MGLASAMSTALTGMNASQTDINVLGNNLANANTVGFKESDTNFVTQFLQTLSNGTAPTGDNGGTNPVQTGLGVMVAGIVPNFSEGTIQVSTTPTDMAIQGNGFFMVQGTNGDQLYTRNGQFQMNSANELTTATGNRVLGYGVDNQFQLNSTQGLVPITIPLGSDMAAQATSNVTLQGQLTPSGDIATTAQRIETGILGDALYTAPATQLTTAAAALPDISGITNTLTSDPAGLAAGTYNYEFVYSTSPVSTSTPPTIPALSEGDPSQPYSVTLTSASDVTLNSIPSPPANPPYAYVNVYRQSPGDSNYYFVNQVPAGQASYTDSAATVSSNPQLNQTMLTGNYSYYMTYYNPTTGEESRPTPISNPVNLVDGRVLLSDLPAASPTDPEWGTAGCYCKIYRNLSSNSNDFYCIGQTTSSTNPGSLIDDVSDDVAEQNQQINLNGPKIIPSTLLTNVIELDGSSYDHVFQTGTLDFTGSKGGIALTTKQFQITSTSTVNDLINFMTEAMGIQSSPSGVLNPIPDDSSGASPGGVVTADGQIILTGNNGVDNAIQINLADMQMVTSTGSQNVNMPWSTLQQAVGQSATTSFTAYDSLGMPIQVRITAVLQSTSNGETTYRWFADSPQNQPADGSPQIAVGTGLISFDGNGNLISSSVTSDTVSIYRTDVPSVSPLVFKFDFSQLSGLSATTSTLSVSQQDGFAPGTLSSFTVGDDGTITGAFSNGVSRTLGQVQLAQFSNPDGLQQEGQDLFAAGINSGLPRTTVPGQQGAGTVSAGATELSNTDVGSSLITLILDSTMYSANSRVISTVQQLYQELLSLHS